MKMASFCLLLILSMLSVLWLYSNPESILPPGQEEMHSTIEAGTEAAETASSKASASKVKKTKPEPTAPKSTKPQETEPEKTEPVATEPKETQPKPTEPKETQPKPTEPKETQPKPTETEETEPVEQHPVALMDLDEEELAPEKPVYDEQRESPASCWKEKDGNRYYQYSDGLYHTGWLELDGVFYYFHDDGRMATGCVDIPEMGKRYFSSTGKEVVLVNPWNMVPEEYSVELGSYSGYKMAKHIISPLKQMLADCKAAGYTAVVSSAYRSHGDQIYLHNRRIQRFLDQGYSEEEAKLEAARRVAVPGTSEHELGLALDIVDSDYRNLTEEQESMPAQKWLIENSWKYGFILRYPNNKSDVTGIIYEPWHYRYVGKELAKELHDSGLCLEEYFAQLTVK